MTAPALSPRQSEILALLIDGLSYKEIAARLDLSPYTVRNHLTRMMLKTGTRSRTQLAVYGLVGVPPPWDFVVDGMPVKE